MQMQPLTVGLILLGIYASTKVDNRLVKLLRFCLPKMPFF